MSSPTVNISQSPRQVSFPLSEDVYLKHNSQYPLLNFKDKREGVDIAMLLTSIRNMTFDKKI